MRRQENYINWTCKSWTASTGRHNSVHLNDNGMPASCFSQHTLTSAIITSERASSLLWETYNTQKALFTAEPCAGVFFFRIRMCEVFICKNRPQLSSNREDCIRLYCKLKSPPISASKLSLFSSNAGFRPRTVKRVVAFLELGVLPWFSMTLFSSSVDQWEPCGCPYCSQVAWANSPVQLPPTPALFMLGQEWSTAWLSSVPSAGYVTATNQKYSGININTLVSS